MKVVLPALGDRLKVATLISGVCLLGGSLLALEGPQIPAHWVFVLGIGVALVAWSAKLLALADFATHRDWRRVAVPSLLLTLTTLTLLDAAYRTGVHLL